jgi:hypothetical protein
VADTYFDRRVAPDLLAALLPGGFADSLVEFGRSGQYCLDLQLRRNQKDRESWATLYAGTTKVLDLRLRETTGKVRLAAHPTYANARFGWQESWASPQTSRKLAAAWGSVDIYLEQVIPFAVRGGYGKEGRVQASLSSYPANDMVVVDRETVVGYVNDPARKRILKQYLLPLMSSVSALGTERWWKPKAPGNECDGLAISADGALLAIEVKPSAVGSVIWAPLQALYYASLLQHWVDETPDAANIVMGMYAQRLQLGLVRKTFEPSIKSPMVVLPVVAIEGDPAPEWERRLGIVATRFADAGHVVDYRRVNLVGRMDPRDFG